MNLPRRHSFYIGEYSVYKLYSYIEYSVYIIKSQCFIFNKDLFLKNSLNIEI